MKKSYHDKSGKLHRAMALKLHENSLFSILLRQPWYVSALVGAVIFALVRIWLEWWFALFAAAPFNAIALYVAWKQLRRPSAKRIAATLERARAMPWEEFCAALEAGFRREGYGVTRVQITRSGRVTLVACKRWKANRTGIEPLREFEAAARKGDAHERVYVAVGEVTDTARAYAAKERIRLVEEEELARLLR
jgi:restriction system protein